MVRRKISRKTPGYMRISLWIIFVAILISLIVFFRFYKAVFRPSVNVDEEGTTVFFVPTGADFNFVSKQLFLKGLVTDSAGFLWLAKKKNYPSRIQPGRYRISDDMSNNELINLLRSGKQEPLMFTFHNLRTLDELASAVSDVLEPDQEDFFNYFLQDGVPEKFGFTPESFPAMFIPDSYEFYWTTSPEEFVQRMKREYVAFWSGKREEKADIIGLSRIEVSTLASIVDQETLHDDENERIAGVFMNRLEKGIPLQSDPTIIFAANDFSIRRVLNAHKLIDSPYNTYLRKGLPPGPISIPSVASIDAVLNYEKHKYIFFCAKPDFSGYHSFARTLSQHNKNARLYQNALNRHKIFN